MEGTGVFIREQTTYNRLVAFVLLAVCLICGFLLYAHFNYGTVWKQQSEEQAELMRRYREEWVADSINANQISEIADSVKTITKEINGKRR